MTLIVLSAPSDVDTASGRYNAGIAGEFLNDLLNKYSPPDTTVTYQYAAEVNRTIAFRDYSHILLIGNRAMQLIPVYQYLYTEKRNQARIIAVPEHTIAVDLRRQKYDDEEDDEDKETGSNKESTPTRAINYAYWIEEGIRKLYSPPKKLIFPEIRIRPSPSDLIAFLENSNVLFVDIETRRNQSSFSPTVLDCIGIGRDSDNTVLVIPIYNYKDELEYNLSILLQILNILNEVFQSKLIVCHNAMFDLVILSLFAGVRIPLRCGDTMLMHHRLASEVEKSLGHLIGQYTDQPYHKDELCVPVGHIQQQRLYEYNAKDVLGTKLVYYAMKEEIDKDAGLKHSVETSHDSIPTYIEMTARGLLVDQDALNTTLLQTGGEVKRMEELVNILAGYTINVGSSQQLINFMHNEHGYKVIKRSKLTNLPSLGKKELQQLAVKTRNPIIPLIINTKKLRKSESMLTFKSL